MTLPVFRTQATAKGNGTSGSLTIPAGVVADDWGFLVVTNGDGMGAPSVPTGWSQIVQAAHINSKTYLTVFAKQYVAGDAAPAITWAVASNFGLAAVWYSGAGGAGVVGTATPTISGTAIPAPSITTASADNVVLSMANHFIGSAGFASTATVAPDAVIRSSLYATAAFGHCAVIADVTKATAGTTNTQTFTFDASTVGSAGVQIAVIPAPAQQVWAPTTDTGSTVTGWTKNPAGAASVATVLGDADPATYIESGDNPTGLVYQSAPFTLAVPADLTSVKVKVSGYLSAGTTSSRVIALLQGATVIKSSTVALTATNAETVIALSSAEAGTMTASSGQWANLTVKVTDTAS